MKIVSVFNNKGGVGKTTLIYHLAASLAELGNKVLMLDLDPQSNLSLYGCDADTLEKIWEDEDIFIDEGVETGRNKVGDLVFNQMLLRPRTIHFLLKPVEDGVDDYNVLPPTIKLRENLELIPGRLTLHQYEDKISTRWNDIYSGDMLAIRTATQIRTLAKRYTELFGYDFVIIDTSPNLGALNRVIISTADGFIIPALPDMFSLYGIRNIGNSLKSWKKTLDIMYSLISKEKRTMFPEKSIQFLGYTIMDLAQAHYNYARQIPDTILAYIPEELRNHLTNEMVKDPMGTENIMFSQSTRPQMAQKYRCPIWAVPNASLESEDKMTISGNRKSYEELQKDYHDFAKVFLERVGNL